MQLSELNDLLTQAARNVGDDAKLARTLGIPKQHVYAWRKGTRTCMPEDVALIASLAGLNAEAWAMRAMVERHEGTAKGDMLMRALGKGLLATGAAIGTAGAHAAAIFSSMPEGVGHLIRCILC